MTQRDDYRAKYKERKKNQTSVKEDKKEQDEKLQIKYKEMKSQCKKAEKKIEELEKENSEHISRVSKLEERVERRDNEIKTLQSFLKQLEIAASDAKELRDETTKNLTKEKDKEVKA